MAKMLSLQKAQSAVQAWESRVFIPLGGSADPIRANCHYQTIIGSEILPVKLLGREFPRSFETTTERLATPDGDWFTIEKTSNIDDEDEERDIVVILHGLESSTKGPLVTKMTTAYLNLGLSCVLVSFRGCGGEDNDTPGGYHLGFTSDVDFVTALLHERYPRRLLYLSGFSLGGNVCLKFLGELGEAAPARAIAGCAVTCVPFDPVASQGKLDKGLNRILYSENFLATLKLKAERQIAKFPGAFDIESIRKCRTIGEFDDEFISKIYSFDGKEDYYRKNGAKWFLNTIRVPTVAINARDDPFIEESSLPTRVDVGDVAPVRLCYHDNGGHCGFIANKLEAVELSTGWLAYEMSRFIEHIRSTPSVPETA